jgi:hypothetical protein
MSDTIWDKTTTPPTQLAYIKRGEVFNAEDKKIATVRDGRLYSLQGEPLGYLQHLDVINRDGNATLSAFRKLCRFG